MSNEQTIDPKYIVSRVKGRERYCNNCIAYEDPTLIKRCIECKILNKNSLHFNFESKAL